MRHLYLLPSVLIFSCTNSSNVTDSIPLLKSDSLQVESSIFSQFTAEIPNLELPLDFGCDVEYSNLKIDDAKYDEFKPYPEGARVVSKFQPDSNHIVILYHFAWDIINPYFYSYDRNGRLIDSISLYNGFCNGDPWLESSCRTKVSSDLAIELFDTVRHFYYEEPERRLDSVVLHQKSYLYSQEGKFELTKELRTRLE